MSTHRSLVMNDNERQYWITDLAEHQHNIARAPRIIKVLCVCEHLSHTKQLGAKVFYMLYVYVDAKLNIQHGDTRHPQKNGTHHGGHRYVLRKLEHFYCRCAHWLVRLFAEEGRPAEFIATLSWQQTVLCKRVKCGCEPLNARETFWTPFTLKHQC